MKPQAGTECLDEGHAIGAMNMHGCSEHHMHHNKRFRHPHIATSFPTLAPSAGGSLAGAATGSAASARASFSAYRRREL